MLEVMSRQCATCIYRKGPIKWGLQKLEDDVRDPRMAGYFKGHRICHSQAHKGKACCRGFWNRHKNHFTIGQIAQRLGLVKFVDPQEDE